jgi:uncharacterized integral membrane protein
MLMSNILNMVLLVHHIYLTTIKIILQLFNVIRSIMYILQRNSFELDTSTEQHFVIANKVFSSLAIHKGKCHQSTGYSLDEG